LKPWLFASVAATSVFAAGPAMAAPQGGSVSAGSAGITHSGNKTDIHQSSHKAIIDWTSFDIAPDEHTQFHQPSQNAIALNRIHDTDASRIDGKLTANGHIMLLNQSGVVFGSGAQIDVGSLTATTADIDNDDFMNGTYDFKHAGKPDAAIINHGSITAKDAGLVTLVAPQVENHGLIAARLGKIQLAAADTFTLDMAGDGLIQVAVSDEDAAKLARNTGRITAEGGMVALTAARARTIVDSLVDNAGIIEAHSMTQQGGKIILGGSETRAVTNSGVLDASGRKNNVQGGEVSVLGDHIALTGGSLIDASGTAAAPVPQSKPDTATLTADKQVKDEHTFLADARRGGGSIKIGGDYLGSGTTPTAKTLTVETGAEIYNDALGHGDGGRTIFWSDDTTRFDGMAYARGGDVSGNGGFVETSGKINLGVNGMALTSSPLGTAGTWLLDPSNVFIVRPGGNTVSTGTNDPSTDNYFINADSIETALGSNNVAITTNNGSGGEAGNITVDATLTWNNGRQLSLRADNDIIINQDITGGQLELQAGNDVDINADIDSTTGDYLLIYNRNAGGTIGIGDGAAGTLHLSDEDLSHIQDGFWRHYWGDNRTDTITLEAVDWGSMDNETFLQTSNSGTIHVEGVQDAGGYRLDFTTDVLNVNAAIQDLHSTNWRADEFNIAADVSSTGNTSINITPLTGGHTMGIGDGAAGDIHFSNTELDHFLNGFSGIYFGNNNITDMDVRAYNWTDSVRFRARDNLTINGDQNFNNNSWLEFTATNLTFNGDLNNVGNRTRFTGDTIAVNGNLTSGSSGNWVFFDHVSSGLTAGLGDGQAGTYHLDDTELDSITGFRRIFFGGENHSNYTAASTLNVGARDWSTNFASSSSDLYLRGETLNINGLQQLGDIDLITPTNDFNMSDAYLQSTARFLFQGFDRNGTPIDVGLGDGATGNVVFDDDLLSDMQSGGITEFLFGFDTNAAIRDIDVQNATWSSTLSLHTDGTGSITTAGDITLTGSGLLRLAAPTINVNGNINRNDGDLELTADTLNVSGSINGTPGTGVLTLGGYTNLGLGDGANTNGGLSISRAAFNTLQSDFNQVHVEAGFGNGDLDLGQIDWTRDDYTIRAGLLTTSADQDFAGGDYVFDINDVNLTNNLTGTGEIDFYRYYNTISLGDNASGGLHFSDAELNLIDDTFAWVKFNRDRTINIGRTTPWNFNVEFSQPGNGTTAVNILNSQNFGSYDVLFATNNMNLDNPINGTGDIIFRAISLNDTIGLGSGSTGDFHLTDAELDNIGSSFNVVQFGETQRQQDIDIRARNWDFNTAFHTSYNKTITVNGLQNFDTYDAEFSTRDLILNADLQGNGGTLAFMGSNDGDNIGVGDNAAGALHLMDADLARIQDGFGLINFGNGNSNTVELNTALAWAASDSLQFESATGGIVTVNSGLDVDTNNLTIKGDEIDLAANLSGTGDIQLTSADVTQEIEIGSTDSGDLNLTAVELTHLQDGWNSITIGDNDHEAEVYTSDDVSFSNNIELRTGNNNLVHVNSDLTTTNSANMILRGHGGNDGRTSGGEAVVVDGNLDIDGDLTFEGLRGMVVYGDMSVNGNFSNTGVNNPLGASGNINVLGNFTSQMGDIIGGLSGDIINIGGNATLTQKDKDMLIGTASSDVDIGGNLSMTNVGGTVNAISIITRGDIDIGGDVTLTNHDSSAGQDGNIQIYNTLQSDGDITLEGDRIAIDPSATISGNADGSSNLTFLEYGEDAAMEIGGTSAGHTWQMTDDELATIQDGFNTITFGSSSMTEDLSVQSINLSGLSSDFEFYGNDIDLGGITMGTGSILAHAMDNGGDVGDLDISAHITRTVDGDATLDLRADQNVTISGGPNILASDADSDGDGDPLTNPDRLNVIFNADRDGDQAGAVYINSADIHTNGGHFTAGGGTDPLTNMAYNAGDLAFDHGVTLAFSDLDTGTGNISILGHGDNDGSSNFGIWTYLSDLTTTTGTITLEGTGGQGTSGNYGVSVHDANITSEEGDISLTGQAQGNGDNNHGIIVRNGSSITSTGTGVNAATITLNGTGASADDYNHGLVIENSGTLISSRDGEISLTGNAGSDGAAASLSNIGILIDDSALIESTGNTADAANITLNGTGAGLRNDNYGIHLDNSASITTDYGHIDLTGQGIGSALTNHYGIYLSGAASIISAGTGMNAGTITLNGTGGDGTDNNYGIYLQGMDDGATTPPGSETRITTVDGAISITGQGGNGSGDYNHGIFIEDEAVISSTGTGQYAGTITLNGTGGDGSDENHGIFLNGDDTLIQSSDGNISLTGEGGINASGINNQGIYFYAGADILSSGTTDDAATITLNATAGANQSEAALYLNGGSVKSGYGDISLTGQAGINTTRARGVMISNFDSGGATEAIVESTGTDGAFSAANIDVDGQALDWNGVFLHSGGTIETIDGDIDVDGSGRVGTVLRYSSQINSTGNTSNAGNISITGIASDGALDRSGVKFWHSSGVSTVDGNVDITGIGGDSTNNVAHGIFMGEPTRSAYLETTGAGSITLDGTAGNCTLGNCHGVYLADSSPQLNYIRTSSTGNIDITGRGGNTGFDNYGIFLEGGSYIESTMSGANAGTITLDGTGGDGTNTNYGVYITDSGTNITSEYGDIDITGRGGDGSGNTNRGIVLAGGADIISDGSGPDAANIMLHGTGGAGGNSNHGVLISGSSPEVLSEDGDITVYAYGGGNGSGDNNTGYSASNGGELRTTGNGVHAGNIYVEAIGGNGVNNNDGIGVRASGNRFQANAGNITLLGTGNGSGTGNDGIIFADTFSTGVQTSGNLSMTGNVTGSGTGTDVVFGTTTRIGNGGGANSITINADSFESQADFIQSTGDIILNARDNTRSIGLGDGLGDLNISGAELAQMSAGGEIVIGASNHTGNVHIDNVDISSDGHGLRVRGGNILVDNGLAADTSLTLIAQNNIRLNEDISANGPGNSVVLVGKSLNNRAGSNAIDAGTGRWLAYLSGAFEQTKKGGLNAAEQFQKTYGSHLPANIKPLGANHFIWALPAVPENNFEINSTVEQQIQIPEMMMDNGYEVIRIEGGYAGGAAGAETGQGDNAQIIIRRKGQRIKAETNEPDAGARLVEGGYMEIEQPIIDFYDLCSYNIEYCR